MKKNHRKRSEVFVVAMGLIVVVFAVLCHFGLLGGTIEIEIPRRDVAFQVKEMPSDLPIEQKSKEEFKEIDLTNEEKLVFLDVSDFQSGSKVVKIWTLTDNQIYYYSVKVEDLPLLNSIGKVDFRFNLYTMEIILRK